MVSVDAIYWKPGWRPSDPKSFETSMTQIANQPSWIIDGNYLSRAGALRGARRHGFLVRSTAMGMHERVMLRTAGSHVMRNGER